MKVLAHALVCWLGPGNLRVCNNTEQIISAKLFLFYSVLRLT